jgi:UDP-N-acetylmuramyl pentapeptide phosphotransferase/UDP-N-acetylglucosamine-1-phosphate transferase
MHSVKIIALLALGTALSYFLVAAIRNYALRKEKLDIPNGRSSHSAPVPRGGGIAFVVVTTILLLFSTAGGTDVASRNFLAFATASVGVASIGLADDWWRELPAKLRLIVHLAIALAFLAVVGVLTNLYLPLAGNLDLHLIPGGVISLLWITGLINAYNFMDGSDGLAGTQAFLGGSAWALLFFMEGQETLGLLAGLLAASSLGFLTLNAPPARIFMGDVGSTYLGFSLSALSVIAVAEMKDPRLPVVGVLMVSVFVFDSGFTVLRRARNRENLLEAHHSHLYQRLIKLGYSHRAVCTRYAVLMAISAGGGLAYYYARSEALALGILAGILGLYLGLAGWVTWLEADHTSGSKLTNICKWEPDK